MMKYALILLTVLTLLGGCQRNDLAQQTLDNSLKVQSNVATQYDEGVRLTMRAFSTEIRSKLFAQARGNLLEEALENGISDDSDEKYVKVAYVKQLLTDLKKLEEDSSVYIDNQSDKFRFLATQSERINAMMMVLDQYIQSQKNVFELMGEQKKSSK